MSNFNLNAFYQAAWSSIVETPLQFLRYSINDTDEIDQEVVLDGYNNRVLMGYTLLSS